VVNEPILTNSIAREPVISIGHYRSGFLRGFFKNSPFSLWFIALFWPRKRESMPTTYNGIGTHYYGKSNVEIRPGTCRSCHRSVQLQSYDTRLWFVIVFIPIIPLGRKRIIDYCPSCRRHYVSDLAKWETARQLEVSGAMDTFRSSPTPENAIAVHQQMLGFHQIAEATEFQKTMVAQFPDSAKIHAYLGAAAEHIGRRDQATESFKRALALRPDLPEARVGLARNDIREGRLDEARKTLNFLEKSGAGQLYSLEPLETLAHAYQNRGDHEPALQLFNRLMEELPKVAEHPGFRKAVQKSEKVLKRGTMLPKQKFSLKRILQNPGGGQIASPRSLLVLGVLAALAFLVFAISNEYIRHHRKIYLVNGYASPATVAISGRDAVKNFRGVSELSLPEGHYHATITGPVKQDIDFDVRDTYFNRWFGDPLWLINVGGGALLELSVATYSRDSLPPAISFHVGKTFEQFPTVTHPFTPLPHSVEVSHGGSKTLVGLEIFDQTAVDVFGYYIGKKNISEALNFAEAWLGAHPEDETMLRGYATICERQKQTNRLDQFLRSGLTARPVRITWHRLFQNLHDRSPELAGMMSEYDSLLRADPTNSALLYLHGRLETNHALARAQFTRAAESDPKNPFASYALGYDRMCAGDWKGARPLLARVVGLSPNDLSFAHVFFVNRIALGEAAVIEAELKKKLARDPVDELSELELHTALANEGKMDEATKETDKFATTCKSRYESAGDALALHVRYHALYAIGNMDKLKALAAGDTTEAGRMTEAMALIEQGQPDEAAKILPTDLDEDDLQLFSFALAIVYREHGNDTAAAQWRAKGIKSLQAGREDDVEAASLLSRDSAPTRAELEDITTSPQLKAIMLTLLSQQYPNSRADLLKFAAQMNVERAFPFHLVKRLAGSTP
jgi:tetratricopeptide (TPR) repeat protein